MHDLAGAVEKLPGLSPMAPLPGPNESPIDGHSDEAVGEDPRLDRVVKAWERLPEHVTQAIFSLVAMGTQEADQPHRDQSKQ